MTRLSVMFLAVTVYMFLKTKVPFHLQNKNEKIVLHCCELLRKTRVCPVACCQMTPTALVFITMMLTGLAMLNRFFTAWIMSC